MAVSSPAGFSTNSKTARKGSTDAATLAAASAFERPSTLSLERGDSRVPPEQAGRERNMHSFLIEIDWIVPDPDQPRRTFDEAQLEELAASLRSRGVKQPITVRWVAALERYMIVDGGRRFEAAKRAGITKLPCTIDKTEGKDVLIDQIVHNWQRADLRPYETADALARLRDAHHMTQQQLAEVTGKPKGEISKLLALHDKVVPEVQEMARGDSETKLTKRHLYNISKLPEDQQSEVAERVQRDGLTAIETERLTRKTNVRRQGIAARQRRFHTDEADVVVTFRKVGHTDDDARRVLEKLLDRLLATRRVTLNEADGWVSPRTAL